MKTILTILYQFSCRRSISDTAEILDLQTSTVRSYYSLIRASIQYFIETKSEKIGGPGVIVDVYEKTITSRKYQRGKSRPSNTVWVVRGVEYILVKCF